MPLYIFECLDCDNTFEMLVRSHDTVKCPDCGSTRLQQCITVPATYTIKGNNSASVTPKKHRKTSGSTKN